MEKIKENLKQLVKEGRAFVLSLEDADATTNPSTGREYADVRKFKRALDLAAKALVLVGLMALPARAWEFRNNPDRFPSVGLTVMNQELSGGPTEIVVNNAGQEIPYHQTDDKRSEYELGGDIRLPVHDSITLTFMYSHIDTDRYFTRYGSFAHDPIYKENGKMSGYRYGFNMRLYFNK